MFKGRRCPNDLMLFYIFFCSGTVMVMATNPPAAPQSAPATAAPTNPPNSAQGPNPAAPVNNVTPQSVGREFVRQYYTLLNKAPKHLHR